MTAVVARAWRRVRSSGNRKRLPQHNGLKMADLISSFFSSLMPSSAVPSTEDTGVGPAIYHGMA